MYIKDDFNFEDLKKECWSGAIDTLQKIEELGLEEELIQLLEEIFEDVPSLTKVNDFLWFDEDYILECLGVNEEE